MPSTADLIIVGAAITTMDALAPKASAIAVTGGLITAVGDESEIRQLMGSTTTVRDFSGCSITPGLIDAHIHPFLGADRSLGADLGDVRTMDAFLAAVRAEADRVYNEGSNSWISGWNLDYGIFDNKPMTSAMIDGAARGLPACFRMFDGHSALASTAALQLAGITGARNFNSGAEIVVDGNGIPTGDLHEHAAIELVTAAMPQISASTRTLRIQEILGRLNHSGITAGAVMNGESNSFSLYEEIDSTGNGFPIRIVSALTHRPEFDEEKTREFVSMRDLHGSRWRGGVIKLYIDGVIDSGTGWLYEPDRYGDGLSHQWPALSTYTDAVRRYAGEGFQIATHAIGDRAIGETITAYEAVGITARNGAPHRIEHLETLADKDLARLATSKITASMQPLHLGWRREDHTDSWAHRLGTERAAKAWRVRDVLTAGVPLALGSDWPVAQLDARIGLAWAQLRRTPGETDAPVFEPDQRLTALQALHGYTVGAAAAQGDSKSLGKIAVGYKADLAVWQENPTLVSPDELISVPIRATFLGGREVYGADA